MRLIPLFALCLSIDVTTALAFDAKPVEPVAAGAAASSAPVAAEAEDAMVRAVLDHLTAQKARLRKDDPRGDVLIQLGTYYSAPGRRAVWVGEQGLRERVAVVRDELRRAGDYGLDAALYDIPDALVAERTPAALAEAEVRISETVLTYGAHARGGRLDPSKLSKWLDQKPRPVPVADLLDRLRASDGAAAADVLRALHPRHPQFEALRQAYLKLRPAEPPASSRLRLPDTGPRLKTGDRHGDIALLRRRLDVPAAMPGDETLLDAPLAEAIAEFMRRHAGYATRALDNGVRSALNRKTARPQPSWEVERLLVNLERWRWMPDDWGDLHVWNNLPEFETRVVRAGAVIHQERIIIGKWESQTPVFSGAMRYVVFQPEWGVPTTIKIRQLLPSLQEGDHGVLAERNMRVVRQGATVDPASIDWDATDIRNIAIFQGSGPDNPLGEIKFMFPNKHAVYMHDTPAKHLFSSKVRTFSAGCIRVRNPRRLAEVIFEAAGGLQPDDVPALFAKHAIANNKVDLVREIPVHNTYFTRMADGAGRVVSFEDVYNHDDRIADALFGRRTIAEIADEDPAKELEEEMEDLAPVKGAGAGRR